MKYLLLILVFNMSVSLANSAGKSVSTELPASHFSELEKSVAKKKEGFKETYLKLQAAAESFKVKQDAKELAKSIKFYHDIFKFEKNHFILEMFSSIYQDSNLRPKLMEAITEGLNPEDRRTFIERLKLVIKEESEGNG